MTSLNWLIEPKRFEIINRTPKIDYKALFQFKMTIKM
jgi:hypothetical protein